MREYYIRREGDEDASGPFDIDQISSLIEANKLDPSAYFYDIETESWLAISSNAELMDTLFPKKRKLSLRTDESEAEKARLAEEAAKAAVIAASGANTRNQGEGSSEDSSDLETKTEAAPVDSTPKGSKPEAAEDEAKEKKGKKGKPDKRPRLEVTQMLAVAEGRANDPSGKSPREKQAAVAFFGLRFLTVFFLCSVLAMAYIERDLIMTADALKMAKSPFLIIAAFDLIVAVTLLLQVTEVYPLLRFRAAIGAGLLSMLFYSSGDSILLASNLLLMGAIYFSSAIIKIRFLIGCGLTGVAGVLGYVYVFFLA